MKFSAASKSPGAARDDELRHVHRVGALLGLEQFNERWKILEHTDPFVGRYQDALRRQPEHVEIQCDAFRESSDSGSCWFNDRSLWVRH